ncbi:MAG: NAD(P)-binding domain-containing protein [Gammaproteobacteria bacterium]|nr:NAD(P)-binding domain-containing protein [Gammaproteobacteria bacterium]
MVKQYETIIIGAGPAGIQLAYFLQQKQRDYLILEGRYHV